jgi:hypothetical protein
VVVIQLATIFILGAAPGIATGLFAVIFALVLFRPRRAAKWRELTPDEEKELALIVRRPFIGGVL